MTYDSYSLENITTVSGVLKTTLFVDTNVGDLTADIPAKNIESIGDVTENVEDSVGVIQFNTMSLTLKETRSVTYPEGFWYELIQTCVDNSYGMPELRFYLTEGVTDTYLFWGRIDPITCKFSEKALTASANIRLISCELISVVLRMKDVDWPTMLSTLLTNAGTSENPTGTPSGLTVTFAGTPGSTTYKYRVAARDANGEYLWSSEATVTDSVPVLNGSGDHNTLTFTGVAAATDYAIYRTYVGGGSLATGFIGLKGSGGSGTITFDDTGFAGDAASTQSKLSARIFVPVIAFLREAVSLAFGQAYGSSSVTFTNEDIRCKLSSSVKSLEEDSMLVWKNFGSVATPSMGYSEYFNSTKDQYLGKSYDVLGACGLLAKNFAMYPRYVYVPATPLHTIELLTRGRYGSVITMDGGVMEPSEQSPDNHLTPKTIRCRRMQEKTDGYTPGANAKSSNFPKDDGNYDLDFAIPFIIQDIVDATASSTNDYGSDFEQLYFVATVGGVTTATRLDGADYYDYGTTAVVAATSDTPMTEVWAEYYRTLTQRKRKIFTRRYGAITATVSTVSSQLNLAALRRITFSDGVSSKTFYATQVTKSIPTKTAIVSWVQQ